MLAGGDFGRRALRQQFAVGDVGQLVAAYRFIHVVGADQHGNAAASQALQFVPEIAARLGIDAGGGLVEQQQLADSCSMQAASAMRCFHPPESSAGELLGAAGETQIVERLLAPRRAGWGAGTCGRRSRGSPDGEVVPEGEPLRHVADIALDFRAFAHGCRSQAGAAAGVGLQQAAHHADGGGLAAAVGAKESEDLPATDPQRHIVDHVLVAEVLVQTLHVDGVFGRWRKPSSQRDLERLAGMQRGCFVHRRLGDHHEDQLRAVLVAVDDRRRVLRLRAR